jgi:LmbE family N-acetylglucosaminyl deacetylase
MDGSPRTLMAVHAHPDDESTSTGGVLTHYARRGYRTVVVTCTNGELGDGPGGLKPGEAGHDIASVAAARRTELERACARLGVSDLQVLGYRDSGLAGGPAREAFCAVPVDSVASRIAEMMDQYRPDVVVTYDPHTGYQHRDHVHTARATARATELTGVPKKLYFKAHGTSYWAALHQALAEAGIQRPEPGAALRREIAAVERRITTHVDVEHVADRKRAGLLAHESQLASSLAARLSAPQFARVFGTETFIRARDTTASPVPETDLFTGLT